MAASLARRLIVGQSAGLRRRNRHGLLRGSTLALHRSSTDVPRAAYIDTAGGKSWSGERNERKKMKRRIRTGTKSGDYTCVTYGTADKYELDGLVADILKDDRFTLKKMPVEFYDAANVESRSQNVLADPSNPGAMFIFRNGVISFWNMAPAVISSILKLSHDHAQDIYPANLVKWESEEMPYTYGTGQTKFQEGKFVLNSEASCGSHTLDMFAFSNALCSSVKLGHWEYMLDSLITSLEPIPVSLIKHQRLKYETHPAVLRKIGEILLLRHRVNLQHNLLDVPDVYWDHEDLEKLYLHTTR